MNNEHFIEDIESGTLIPVSKEYKEEYHKFMKKVWDKAYLTLKTNIPIGKIICFGTGGDYSKENDNHLEDLFYNPENYKLLNLEEGEHI